MAGAQTVTKRIGTVRWRARADVLPLLEARFPEDRDPASLPPGAQVLKQGSGRTVYRLADGPEDGPLLVKVYRPLGRADRLGDLVRKPRAEREFENARALAALGVPTPLPLACGVFRGKDAGPGSLYLSRFEEDAESVLDRLQGGETDPALWEALGRLVARVHRAGVWHPDLHLGNVLARRTDGGWALSLVDVTSLRPGGPLTARGMRVNLAQVRNAFIAGRPRDFLLGLRSYLAAGGEAVPDRHGLARGVADLADGMLASHFQKRTARCLVNSSAFARGRSGAWSVARRREISLEEALEAVRRSEREADLPVLKDGNGTRVTAGLSAGGVPAVVKRYRPGGPGARLVSLAGRSRGRRAWVGGNGLAARGFDVPRPLALVERRLGWIRLASWVVMEDLRRLDPLDRLSARRLEAGETPLERREAEALGALLGRLHRCGVYHADCKACNVLVERGAEGPRFFLLDHDRVVFGREVERRRRVKNLVQLNTSLPRKVSASSRGRFLRAYLKACPFPGGFKALWREVLSAGEGREVVYVTDHGDAIEEGFASAG